MYNVRATPATRLIVTCFAVRISIRGGLGIADQSGVFKISFKNIFKEALAK